MREKYKKERRGRINAARGGVSMSKSGAESRGGVVGEKRVKTRKQLRWGCVCIKKLSGRKGKQERLGRLR